MLAQRSTIELVVSRYKDALRNRGITADRLILFGSHAKGTATQYSDIDLIVVSNDFANMNFEQRCSVLGWAIADIMEPIEPLAYTPEEFLQLSPFNVIGSIVRDQGQYIELL
jgi:predicted nucleotidyltransferase